MESKNKNILSNHSFVSGRVKADCNLIALQELTINEDKDPFYAGIGDSIWTALAIQHLNAGDGSYIGSVDGLNERCGINFNLEFIDTEGSVATAMTKLVNRFDSKTSPHLPPPCGFIGATYSPVSESTSSLTNRHGYVQVSGSSTSTYLDSRDKYPFFARTIPNNKAIAKAIISWLKKIGVKYFCVLHADDSWGFNFVEELRQYSIKEGIEMIPIIVHPDLSNIVHSINVIKSTQFNYVISSLFYDYFKNGEFILEAMKQGVIHDRQWFFYGNNYGSAFEGITGLDEDQFVEFYNSTGAFYYGTMIPDEISTIYEQSMQEILNSDGDNIKYSIRSMLPPLKDFNWNRFTLGGFNKYSHDTLYYYEAVIMLGLSACNAAGTNSNLSLSGTTDNDLYLNTTALFKELVNMEISSKLTGDVIKLNNRTGSRVPETAHFVVSNNVIDYEIDVLNNNKSVFYGGENNSNTMILLSKKTDLFFQSQWKSIHPFIYKDGSTTPIPDLQPVNEQPLTIHTSVKVISYLFCIFSILLAVGLSSWTMNNRKTRIVNASQPFFLNMVCFGVLILAVGIIPASMELQHHLNVTAEENFRMIISCTSRFWCWFIGFAIIFSSLLGKAYRINKIMKNAKHFKRVTVTVQDTLIPITIILMVNIIMLSLLSAFHPIQYELHAETFDEFGRPVRTSMHCKWDDHELMYIIPLILIDGSVLCLAIYQLYLSRHLSTEYQESKQIFRALICIFLVLLFAAPICYIAREESDGVLFVISAVTFISSWCILLLIFLPKIRYERRRKVAIASNSVIRTITAAAAFIIDNNDNDNDDNNDDGDQNSKGDAILSTKNSESLIQLNKTYRQRYQAKEEELHALNITNEDLKIKIETLEPAQIELEATKEELRALIITNEDMKKTMKTLPAAP